MIDLSQLNVEQLNELEPIRAQSFREWYGLSLGDDK